ncbi:MAG TPA: LEA type 2 family protein [Bacteroidales bacterium]|nr:LEA type 2 family protein [Bacteroidales bacterium]
MKTIFFLIITVVLTSCKINEVEVKKFESIKFKNIGENKANLELMIPVNNPNKFGFTISDIKLDLALNGKEVGKVKKTTKLRIPAHSNQSYPVGIEIEIDKALGNIASLTAGLLKNKMGVKAKGYVKVRKFIFTKKFPIDQNEAVKIF